jgi:hypothetical protein
LLRSIGKVKYMKKVNQWTSSLRQPYKLRGCAPYPIAQWGERVVTALHPKYPFLPHFVPEATQANAAYKNNHFPHR